MAHDGNEYNKLATEYDPIKIGSIDGTDTEPHDRAILRALYSEYTPNKLVKGDPKHTIFVARLNPRTTQETIHAEFSKFGKILHCRLVKDIVTGKSKQYAFVEFDKMVSVEMALKHMHAEYLDGVEVIVEREAERRLAGWRPRRMGGGFGGRRESGQLRFGCREKPHRKPIIIGTNEVTSTKRRAEGERSRAVREVRARLLPGAQCSGAGATRHLSRGSGQRAAACGPRALCAGAAASSGSGYPTCAFCAGTPLLRGAVLLGTMAAAPCGDFCEPALYVNIATVLDWLQSILNNE